MSDFNEGIRNLNENYNILEKEYSTGNCWKLSTTMQNLEGAMLLDGMRVIGDIMFFVKQKERVKNFTESTQEIDSKERILLIQLLEGKIASPNE